LIYLTGLHFHVSERPVVAIFTPHSPLGVILPELEAGKLTNLPYPASGYCYGENPGTWSNTFARSLNELGIKPGEKIGVEPRYLRLLELWMLEAALPGLQLANGDEIIASLRMVKDTQEVDAMRAAIDIAQNALQATLPFIKAGVTEKDVASELVTQLLRAGTDSSLPFSPIVSGGPNSANPHASPGDRMLQAGDLLVIDWGAAHDGYFSDLTRTFAIGYADPHWIEIAQIVAAANAAGLAAAQPGVPASAVDLAARGVIEAAGYGSYFTHRTGHGLGLEGHEEPYIRSDNHQILTAGMTFTIEPGIYFPGRNGVRIEDNVVIIKNGVECLSDLPRELIVLG
jgi:Xaa-Pro dipeptidase